ncbi:MAG: phosphoglycerate dehydrogenase [Clostridia bacterium]|nr:phosphoglycerate dehydrogenase [Clostridia bacterium]MBR6523951.1 phosphoglycerate dehydrogenase [Clostridia bacterium]
MYKVKTLNKIAKIGLDIFDEKYTYGDEVENPDGIILRSFNMHEMELPESLAAVARAGAGVNNIPIDKCSEKGIVVFNTPGANANAVKELVIAGLLLASRKVVQGIEWAKTLIGEGDQVSKLVEKGKSSFAGPEIQGKTLGIIGLGAIGIRVANAAHALGMNVIGYDPYLSVDAAWKMTRAAEHAKTVDDVLAKSDYISIHVPATKDTKGMFNADLFRKVKPGVRLLNFSRAELVDTEAVLKALEDGTVAEYVTDFATEELLKSDRVIVMPHLGASTPESEDNCAVMAAQELKDFLENGNITNSVNFPNCDMGKVSGSRVTIAHKNIPSMLNQITDVFTKDSINIENMVNKSKGDYAYTMIDTHTDITDAMLADIKTIDGVIKVSLYKED